MHRLLPLLALTALALASGLARAEDKAAAPATPAGSTGASGGTAEAHPRGFTAVATPDKVRLGDPFLYTVEIRHAKDERYELPRTLELGDAFNVVDVDTRRTNDGDDAVTRFELKLSLFALQEQKIPDLVLTARTPQGLQELKVPGPTVTGLSDIPEDKAEMMDIMPPVEVLVPRYRALALAAGILAALVALLLFVRWWRARPEVVKVVPPPPPVPAHERALAALAELQRQDPAGHEKEAHFRISEILRDYLGARFAFNALDMTTEELLTTLRRVPTPGLDYRRFEEFSRSSDLVKFARVPASAADVKAALDFGVWLVQSTMPHAATAPTTAAQPLPPAPPPGGAP